MKIRVDKLIEEFDELESLLDRYEINYLSFYSEIKECSINWKGVYADVFFDNVNIEKKDTQLFYNELLSFRDIYKDIIINKNVSKYLADTIFILDIGYDAVYNS